MMEDKTHKLMLINDSENDVLYVMACLIRICNHARDQAEQCAIITHNNGKCDIKSGSIMEMIEVKGLLEDLGLKTEIEEYESSMY
jgi:ATP-dependent Clp protease adaptor protein ClpS